ncbi:hypothetical protein ACFE04_005843 [Oxalis oulophora]
MEKETDNNSPMMTTTESIQTETVTPTQTRSVKTKVPEVEIHLYNRGKGPIEVFKSALGGWDQDQLEVQDILDKYGFKSIYAFSPQSGRTVPIRFHPRNGRSILSYKDGSLIHVDGEPKDSLIKPVTRILLGVVVVTVIIAIVVNEPPKWLRKLNVFGADFPPWVVACMVIVFTRMRKRTRDFIKKFGW